MSRGNGDTPLELLRETAGRSPQAVLFAEEAGNTTAQDLVDKVRELSASKFVDSGFTAALIDLAVTSHDGKRVEKVSISKAGDNYIAKRENDSTLYQIDSKTLDDLNKSAEGLKPVAVPGK